MKIKTKTKPALPAKQLFEVDGQEFETEEAAQEFVKEQTAKLESRKKDYLIAEKLLGYIWIHRFGENELVHPRIKESGYFEERWNGFDKDCRTDYINYCSSNEDKQVPKFENSFNDLYWALIKNGYEVYFGKKDKIHWALISKIGPCPNEEVCDWKASFTKPESYWCDEVCWMKALKEAAFLLAKTL